MQQQPPQQHVQFSLEKFRQGSSACRGISLELSAGDEDLTEEVALWYEVADDTGTAASRCSEVGAEKADIDGFI